MQICLVCVCVCVCVYSFFFPLFFHLLTDRIYRATLRPNNMFVCFAAIISPGQTLAVTATQACLAQGCQYHQTGWYEYISESDTCTDLIS